MSHKYARIERERRFVLAEAPTLAPTRVREITDWYIRDSSLRLRTVEEAGLEPVFKLGQKTKVAGASISTVWHTTMYLNAPEYTVLRCLAGHLLTKQRRSISIDSRSWCVDIFSGELNGLVMAETELAESGLQLQPPGLAVAEVPEDVRFTGGALAAMSAGQVAALRLFWE